MSNYNTSKPKTGRQQLWRTIEIGWKHTVDGDDIIIAEDENGEPIPNTVHVPCRVSARHLLDSAKKIDPKVLEELTKEGGLDLIVELVGAVIGRDLVLDVASDLTVSKEDFITFIVDVATSLGIAGDNPNSPTPAS